MKRVVVLGCGPAGLLAAHAASLELADVTIFSVKQPSFISGAQFLHKHIPGITGTPDGNVLFIKYGSREGYAKKVYGDPKTPVSWDLWENATARPAWSMRMAYNFLWAMYRHGIKHYEIRSPEDVRKLEALDADLYVSSIPAYMLCNSNEHFFEAVPMWIATSPNLDVPLNTIVYNGDPSVEWNRASNLFGHKSVEYSCDPEINGGRVIEGRKPTGHNCDCAARWIRVGRFGSWKRGVLVHHAFEEVRDALQQMR